MTSDSGVRFMTSPFAARPGPGCAVGRWYCGYGAMVRRRQAPVLSSARHKVGNERAPVPAAEQAQPQHDVDAPAHDQDVGDHREALAEAGPEAALLLLDHLAEPAHDGDAHAVAEVLGEEVERDLDLEVLLVAARHVFPQRLHERALAAEHGREVKEAVGPVGLAAADADEHVVGAGGHR